MPSMQAANGGKKTKSSTSAGAGGRKKGPSPYNLFMKSKLAEFQQKYPNMTHKERFKKVAEAWKTSSENPANQADQ